MTRKLGLLAAVTTVALGASSAVAAAATYVLRDGVGNPLQQGKFGSNFQLRSPDGQQLALTVPTGPSSSITNMCDGFIGGQVLNNTTAGTLKANVQSHTFSSCDHAPTFAAGTWLFTINQNQSGAGGVHNGRINGVDLLLPLGGGVLCEYKGGFGVKVTNGSPTTLTFTNASIPLFTGSGTFTNSTGCPPAGSATGTLVTEAVTSVSGVPQNIQIS